jgi:hypothetical protein
MSQALSAFKSEVLERKKEGNEAEVIVLGVKQRSSLCLQCLHVCHLTQDSRNIIECIRENCVQHLILLLGLRVCSR